MPNLKVHAVSDYAGMWVLRREDTQEIVAIVSMFVDDGLAFGKREALLRFGELVGKKWKVKWQGLLFRIPFEGHVKRGAVELEYAKEIMFVGTQSLSHMGVEISQHLWLLQELQKRQLIHLKGQEGLPALHEGELRDEREDSKYAARKAEAQKELGSLLWLVTKSRGDIAAVVGAAATCLTRVPSEALRIARGTWRYLRSTCFLTVRVQATTSNVLTGYSDASFAPGGSRSRTGTVISWGANPMCWSSRRQNLTAFSSCEAEVEGMTATVQDLLHAHALIFALTDRDLALELKAHNASAVTLVTRERFVAHGWRTRHFAIRAS